MSTLGRRSARQAVRHVARRRRAPVQIHDRQVRRPQRLVVDAARLDQHEPALAVDPARVAAVHGDEPCPRQLHVRLEHLLAQGAERLAHALSPLLAVRRSITMALASNFPSSSRPGPRSTKCSSSDGRQRPAARPARVVPHPRRGAGAAPEAPRALAASSGDGAEMGRLMARELVDFVDERNRAGRHTRVIVPCGPSSWYAPWTEEVNAPRRLARAAPRLPHGRVPRLAGAAAAAPPSRTTSAASWSSTSTAGSRSACRCRRRSATGCCPSTIESVRAAIDAAPIDLTLGGWGQDGHVAYNQARRHPYHAREPRGARALHDPHPGEQPRHDPGAGAAHLRRGLRSSCRRCP